MIFNKSADGKERTTVVVKLRLTKDEIYFVKRYLKMSGQKANFKEIRDEVRECAIIAMDGYLKSIWNNLGKRYG